MKKSLFIFLLVIIGFVLVGCDTDCKCSEQFYNHDIQSITVETPSYKDISNLLSYDAKTNIFTAKSGYNSYTWYIDGVKQTNTTNSFTVIAADLKAGWHNICLQVSDSDGTKYSVEDKFEIKKEQ